MVLALPCLGQILQELGTLDKFHMFYLLFLMLVIDMRLQVGHGLLEERVEAHVVICAVQLTGDGVHVGLERFSQSLIDVVRDLISPTTNSFLT
jgi:hypothetical protein